jgi:hypothetical protein
VRSSRLEDRLPCRAVRSSRLEDRATSRRRDELRVRLRSLRCREGDADRLTHSSGGGGGGTRRLSSTLLSPGYQQSSRALRPLDAGGDNGLETRFGFSGGALSFDLQLIL